MFCGEFLVYNSPSREPTEISVVDEEVRTDLAAHVTGMASLFRVGAVYRVRWDSFAIEEFHCLVQFFAMAVGP